jgi:hypothetical protein
MIVEHVAQAAVGEGLAHLGNVMSVVITRCRWMSHPQDLVHMWTQTGTFKWTATAIHSEHLYASSWQVSPTLTTTISNADQSRFQGQHHHSIPRKQWTRDVLGQRQLTHQQ